jgi:3-deoxy-manno-octulosonate cytidylyltransferase (CMP-KDO synthetase)
MLEEVWRRASTAGRIERLVVATDDRRISDACERFGAEVLLTDAGHTSGTDRAAEVVERLGDAYTVVLNIQGDEPLVTGSSLDRLVGAFDAGPDVEMATLSEPIESIDDLLDPNVVKVVAGGDGRALYFSRSPIPYHRARGGAGPADLRQALAERPGGLAGYRRHQGIYAYRRNTLLELSRLEPSPLEIDESLEQLRALEAGIVILVVESDFSSQGVDTPADLERVARILGEAR